MARYKKLDQNSLLDSAEAVIREQGAHALSIGSVANEAGVSRGGIQSSFGTKENLIDALFDRWSLELGERYKAAKAEASEGTDQLDIFLQASKDLHLSDPKRNAAMMILMTQSEERRQWARHWISERMAGIDTSTQEGRRQRLKFLACESLLVIKSIQIIELSDTDWLDIFNDLNELL